MCDRAFVSWPGSIGAPKALFDIPSGRDLTKSTVDAIFAESIPRLMLHEVRSI